jgi:transglutaminase-like putative cysteine protease
VALSQFDGERWSKLPDPPELLRNSLDGRFDLARLRQPGQGTNAAAPRLVLYRVMMEPIASEVFFLAPTAQALMGGYQLVSVDEAGAVSNEDRSRMIGSYRAISDISTPPVEGLQAAGYEPAPDIALRYLQLPGVDRRVGELAQQVTASADNSYDKAAALERHLRTAYQYTLQLPGTRPSDPVAHFLFERKAGHCEYFASAMTIMLRTLGIPARIVNGFSGGEFNPVTGSYIVRARDAHSWVEAYFSGYGWVSFDPTPPSPRPVSMGWKRMALYVDAMREFWREWVINYDFAHQTRLSTAAVAHSRHAVHDLRGWWKRQYRALVNRAHQIQGQAIHAPGRFAALILGGVMLSALLLNLRRLLGWWRERSVARRPEQKPQAAAAIWYSRMTRFLARRGSRKLPCQTPSEFATALADPKLRRTVETFTECYERARFGESADDAQRLPELYAKVAATDPVEGDRATRT